LIPARLSAILIALTGFGIGGNGGRRQAMVQAMRGLWAGRRLTASPNAGWTIGAMSGLLGVALQKPGHYRIGDGLADPGPAHIAQSVRVALAVAGIGVLAALGVAFLRGLAAG